jgi:hypothetical protein
LFPFLKQEFAEKLFKKLEGLTEKFEVKVMLLELVSRLMGRFIRIRIRILFRILHDFFSNILNINITFVFPSRLQAHG